MAEWHHSEWAYLNPEGSVEKRKEKMLSYLSGELFPSTYLAKEMNELTGSAAMVKPDMDSHPEYTPWLASVYVAPKCRCRGVGTMLVKYIVQQAFQSDMNKLFLFTPNQDSFYKSIGWEKLASEMYRGSVVTIMSVKRQR